MTGSPRWTTGAGSSDGRATADQRRRKNHSSATNPSTEDSRNLPILVRQELRADPASGSIPSFLQQSVPAAAVFFVHLLLPTALSFEISVARLSPLRPLHRLLLPPLTAPGLWYPEKPLRSHHPRGRTSRTGENLSILRDDLPATCGPGGRRPPAAAGSRGDAPLSADLRRSRDLAGMNSLPGELLLALEAVGAVKFQIIRRSLPFFPR